MRRLIGGLPREVDASLHDRGTLDERESVEEKAEPGSVLVGVKPNGNRHSRICCRIWYL
jgi:hypothetical protein